MIRNSIICEPEFLSSYKDIFFKAKKNITSKKRKCCILHSITGISENEADLKSAGG